MLVHAPMGARVWECVSYLHLGGAPRLPLASSSGWKWFHPIPPHFLGRWASVGWQGATQAEIDHRTHPRAKGAAGAV